MTAKKRGKAKKSEQTSEPEARKVQPDTSVETPVKAMDFPIVGIGASAGGLAAFEAFFSGMPGEAIKLDAATYVLPPATIAAALVALVKKMKGKPQ